MKKFIVGTLFCLILLAFTNAFAQQQINVRSLKITQNGRFSSSSLDLKAFNSLNEPVNYYVADATLFIGNIPFIQCSPCSPPKLFQTNVFQNPISTQINSQSNTVINFYHDASYSSPIYLGNIILSRKNNFYMSGETRLRGKIEIINAGAPPESRLIAFDNDVDLSGFYSVGYFKPYLSPSGKKLTDFRSLEYLLTDSR